MNEISVTLTQDELTHLVNILGELPNRSNTFSLAVKLSQVLAENTSQEETE